MNCEVELEELSKDFIKELGNIGTGNAVSALSQLLNCPLEIDTPNLRVLPFQQITEIIAEAETPLTGIMVEVFGEINGMFLFLLDETFTGQVVRLVLGEEITDFTRLTEMEESLLLELGNIMCGSYIRALSSFWIWRWMFRFPRSALIWAVPYSLPLCHVFSEQVRNS